LVPGAEGGVGGVSITSWQPFVAFYGPDLKQGATIPYAELPLPDGAVPYDVGLSSPGRRLTRDSRVCGELSKQKLHTGGEGRMTLAVIADGGRSEPFTPRRLLESLLARGLQGSSASEVARTIATDLRRARISAIPRAELGSLVDCAAARATKSSRFERTVLQQRHPSLYRLPCGPSGAPRMGEGVLRTALAFFEATAVSNPALARFGRKFVRAAAVLAEAQFARSVGAAAEIAAAKMDLGPLSRERLRRQAAQLVRPVTNTSLNKALSELSLSSKELVETGQLKDTGDPLDVWRLLNREIDKAERDGELDGEEDPPGISPPPEAAWVKVGSLERQANLNRADFTPLHCFVTADQFPKDEEDEPQGVEVTYKSVVSAALAAPEDSAVPKRNVRRDWQADLNSDLPPEHTLPIKRGFDASTYFWFMVEDDSLGAPDVADAVEFWKKMVLDLPGFSNPDHIAFWLLFGPTTIAGGLIGFVISVLFGMLLGLLNEIVSLFGDKVFTPIGIVHATLWEDGPPKSFAISGAGSALWKGQSAGPGPMPVAFSQLETVPALVWAPSVCGLHCVAQQTADDAKYAVALRADVRAI
jgi:hypothetical protein